MSGFMRKAGLYLGLVEDDEDGRRYDDGYDPYDEQEPAPVRRWTPAERAAAGPRRGSLDTRG